MTADCPTTGRSAGLVMPSLNIATINPFLAEISRRLGPGVHAVLIWDNAGFHTGKGVVIPSNITLMALPPYAPELNPVENLRHYLQSRYWSLRVYKNYRELKQAAVKAWRSVCLVPSLEQSVCAAPYVKDSLLEART